MGPTSFQKDTPTEPKKSNLELLMENFMMTQTRQNDEFRNKNLLTDEALRQLNTKVDNVVTHNKMLETKISQVGQQQAASSIPPGSFLGQPEQNTKGHLNVVTTCSGKKLGSSSEREREIG